MTRHAPWRVATLAVAASWPFAFAGPEVHRAGTRLLVLVLVGLSLTPTVGWLRAVTLYQPAAVAAGAAGTAALLSAGQALPLTLVVAAAAGAVVGLAAVAVLPAAVPPGDGRTAVAVTSLALTAVVWAFGSPGTPARPVARPVLFGIDLAGERTLYLAGLLIVVVAYRAMANLRRSPVGRRLLAAGWAPELAARSGGRLRGALLQAVGSSGLLAGVAGWLTALLQQAMPATGALSPALAVAWLAVPYIGGAPWPEGALVGAAVLALVAEAAQRMGATDLVAAGTLLVVSVALLPQGLVGLCRRFPARARAAPPAPPVGGDPGARAAPPAPPVGGDPGARAAPPAPPVGGDPGGAMRRRASDPRLMLHAVSAGGVAAVTAAAGAGQWVRVGYPDPDALVALVAGTGSGRGRVVVDGQQLSARPAPERCRAGLASATGRLPELPVLRVLDVVALAHPVPPEAGLWQAAVGTQRARAASADSDAAARALGGRLGLGAWLDRDVTDLPAEVAALVDVARALAAAPKALVWRSPEWLSPGAADDLRALVAAEQPRLQLAVLEVATGSGR